MSDLNEPCIWDEVPCRKRTLRDMLEAAERATLENHHRRNTTPDTAAGRMPLVKYTITVESEDLELNHSIVGRVSAHLDPVDGIPTVSLTAALERDGRHLVEFLSRKLDERIASEPNGVPVSL